MSPKVGTWTPDFKEETSCSCSKYDTDCHALYVAKVLSLDGNVAQIRFQKTGGGTPSTDVHYWIVVAEVTTPECTALPVYHVRTEGTWKKGTTLTVDVPVWPSSSDCKSADEGEYKKMFIITGGGGGFENQKVWFQKKPLRFTRTCD